MHQHNARPILIRFEICNYIVIMIVRNGKVIDRNTIRKLFTISISQRCEFAICTYENITNF
jgi:hypothetical protein